MADREAEIGVFLDRAGWSNATRHPLAGDASTRQYERLNLGAGTAILMDAPPDRGSDVVPFVEIARHLENLGLSPPKVLAADHGSGLLLLEDLGDALFAHVLERDPRLERELYEAATDLLVTLQGHAGPAGLTVWDTDILAGLVTDALAWLPIRNLKAKNDISAELVTVLEGIPTSNPVMALRDYHAENLIWLPQRSGDARVGLLDFQDAFAGPPIYDLVSLLCDARRDVSDDVRSVVLTRFARAKGFSEDAVDHAAAVTGVQRSLRILGVFFRLAQSGGKPGYLRFVPRVWGHILRDLDHPALASLKGPVLDSLAEPISELSATPCPTAPTV